MKRYLTIALALVFLVGFSANFASAVVPAVATQDDEKKKEAEAYKAWYDVYTAKEKDWPKVIELAKEFIQKFPNNTNIKYVQGSIATARTNLLTKATQDKNIPEIIRLANESAAETPDKELDYYTFIVAQIATDELFAQPPNYSHSAQAMDYAQKSVKLIEAGKKPTTTTGEFDKNKALAYLFNVQAVIARNNKNSDKALEYYQRAASYAPIDAQYPLQCGSLHQQKYAAAAAKYQEFPEEKRTVEPDKLEPAVKAALDDVNKEADAVIACWARFMYLTKDKSEWAATRTQVEKVLTDLYKFRHNDSTDGLQELIESNRNVSSPASNGSTVSQF